MCAITIDVEATGNVRAIEMCCGGGRGGVTKAPREEISEFLDPRTVALKLFCPFWLT